MKEKTTTEPLREYNHKKTLSSAEKPWLNAEEPDHSYYPWTEDRRRVHTHGGFMGKKQMTAEGHVGARHFILAGNGGKSSEWRSSSFGKKGGNWNPLSSLKEKKTCLCKQPERGAVRWTDANNWDIDIYCIEPKRSRKNFASSHVKYVFIRERNKR